jgi:parallel beta-helix repeat protein
MRIEMSIRLLSLAVVAAVMIAFPCTEVRAVDPGSQLIDCSRKDALITLGVTSHLDPSCTWTQGVEIVASDVTLDCQGAHIVTTDRSRGILIMAPTTVALSNITVRNCHVEGFLNNVRVTRVGFRDLAEGFEYENGYSNILIEDSTFLNSRGSGIFVDGYVTGVTLRSLHIEGSGSVGIYLEAGSKDNVVEDNQILSNGYGQNGPTWQLYTFGGVDFWFWGTGREGLAVDGSRFNQIRNNTFSGNSAGAVFLYKNCGEFVNQKPETWWLRRYGADGNVIEGNTVLNELNGVWVGSRMGENTFPMDCSDPQYQFGVVLDYASGNVVRANTFQNVTYAIRVEGDDNTIEDNIFTGDYAVQQAVIVGTRFRTPALMLPVDGTTISGNQSTIAGNTHPYRWAYGESDTTFAGNQSLGRNVGLCEGQPPPANPFIFVVSVVPDTSGTPPPDPPVVPTPAALPPCPLMCSASVPVAGGRIRIGRLDTPPGDDTLTFKGRALIAHPFSPPLDPVANGIGVVISDATGAKVIDAFIPGGAWDRETRVGWIAVSRGKWRYRDQRDAPPQGVTRVVIKDRSSGTPGLVQFGVKGKDGAFAVQSANLPLTGYFVLDPPTAETGQCGEVSFPAPDSSCTADGRTVKCN